MDAVKRSLMCFIWMAVAAAPALAQTAEPRRYVTFPIDKNVEAIVKERLKIENDLGPFKDLIKQIMADPKKLPFDAKQFKDMKLDDPKLKKAVEDWIKSDPELQKTLGDWVKQNQGAKPPQNVQQLDKILKDMPQTDKPAKTPDVVKLPEPVTPKVDPLAKAAERAMKQAEDSKLGDWLRESPAWKRAFEDLRTSLENPNAARWKLGEWQGKLLPQDGKAWKLGEQTLERIRKMPQPDLERWTSKLSLPGLGKLPMPNLGPPGAPHFTGPSLPSLSTGATWLFLALVCLLAGWQTMRWTKRMEASPDGRIVVGPWPVKPEQVSTRAELVQAFDYLALRTLGLEVKSWNHQAVARRWCEKLPTCAPLTQALALLYEQARYTDGVGALSAPQRDQSRQSLRQLAEAL